MQRRGMIAPIKLVMFLAVGVAPVTQAEHRWIEVARAPMPGSPQSLPTPRRKPFTATSARGIRTDRASCVFGDWSRDSSS